MKVAVLVLAHAAPTCLDAAATVYRAAGFDVFVHLDKKINIADYKSAMGVDSATNCHFIDETHSIFWAGFNMVRAEISLLNAAIAQGHYNKFVLVSDDTFPLVPPADLAQFFDDDINRIDIRHIIPTDPFYPRYEKFFILDHNATSLIGRQIELSCFDQTLLTRIDELRGIQALGKSPIDIYYGSQWWALTRAAVDVVLHAYLHDTRLIKSFEFSAVPDEMMIQTILGNDVAIRPTIRRGCVYVDWTKDPRPYVYWSQADLPTATHEHVMVRKIGNDASFINGLLDHVMKPHKPLQ